MDTTTLTSEFNQYTLVQRKLFLDWIELPIENDEEARQRFLNSLDNPNNSDSEGELNKIEINERFDLLIKRLEKQEKNTIQVQSLIGPGGIAKKNIQQKCRIKCRDKKERDKYNKCFEKCIK